MKKVFKNALLVSTFFASSVSWTNSVFASGDELIKTWRNKQEAYYNGETLVEQNTIEAIKRMDGLLKKYKWPTSKKVSMLHKLADLHLNAGRIEENKSGGLKASTHTLKALRIYKTIIQAYPNYENLEFVLFSSGFELFMRKEYSEAQKTLAILNKRFPKSKFKDEVFVIRADSYFELNQFTEALKLYTKANQSTNEDLAVYSRYRKSWALFNLKRYNEAYDSLFALAKEDIQKGARNLYSSEEAIADLPRFFHKQTKKKDASNDFITVVGLKKTEPLLFELSELYFESGYWDKSSKVFNTLIARYPNSKMRSVYHLKNGIALSTKKEITTSSLEIQKGLKNCKSQLCSSIAQDDIFKLVNDWERHWRKKQNDISYRKALSTVYPALASIAQDKKEKSKIYLLLADVEYASKNYKNASIAFELSYKENPEAPYAKQSKWAAIESLMNLKTKKWLSRDLDRLAGLVNNFISEFPTDKRSIAAQSFLAKSYNDSDQEQMASNLYKRVSETHLYTKTGAEAYNSFLKIKVDAKDYETATKYLLNLSTIDEKGLKRKLISNDLDDIYTEWSESLAKNKKMASLIAVYNEALKNRPSSSKKKDWLWNRSLALVATKSYKKAGDSFLEYERDFGNSDGKRVEALNNAYVSFNKAKLYSKSLNVISKLLQFDKGNRNDWLVESVKIHIETKKYMTAFEILSQVSRNHPEKNNTFERLITKLDKKELDKIRRSNLNSFSGDAVGELLLKLIYKIDDLESQQTKTTALRLRNVNSENRDYNAKGHYILANLEQRKFEKINYNITSNLQRSLDKMLRRVMSVDGHYRSAVEVGSSSTQTKAILGLATLYLEVVKKYTKYAKQRIKAKKSINDVDELMAPFLEQSLVFCNEAKDALKGVGDKRTTSKLKNRINVIIKKTKRYETWYKKNTQVNLAKNGDL
jgi:TolA-binding protein